FLLVHGTTQSPDGWRLLIDELSAIGHSAVTTDLARFGERASATEYAEAVAAELSGPKVDVVVAHSGSGLLLPAIASATEATMQVYLAAFVPNGSRSVMDEVNEDATAMFNVDWIGVDPTSDHDAARRFLFHDCSPEVAEWAVTTLRSFVPTSAYSEQVPLAPAIPATSVVPDSDRTLRPEWMIAASRERLGVAPTIVPGGHCPHVSRPRDLARILSSVLGAG
ncbi:MAG: alpha/beta hydrolase, partial [Ilumatobacteraceae bacterium]